MNEEIKKLLGDFLVEKTQSTTPRSDKFGEELRHNWIENPHWEDTAACHDLCKTIEGQLTRAIAISDGVMEWESLADTRKSMKDLAQLKQDIKDNE